MVDSHSHSKLSHDGKVKMEELRNRAEELGMTYFAITEHLDRDYKFGVKEKFVRQLNLPKYKLVYKFLKEKYKQSPMYFAFGVEAGFCPKAVPIYERELKHYNFDVIINSIHTVDGGDAYFSSFFRNKNQVDIYNRYLELLIESLDVPYPYNLIGHIGYITRYAPYENPSLWQPEYQEKIDILLKKIIEKDKTIEINTHIRDNTLQFLPEIPILQRYYDLGGRKIVFSSDAHRLEEVGSRYDLVLEEMKKIGFTHWTVYKKQQPFEVPFE